MSKRNQFNRKWVMGSMAILLMVPFVFILGLLVGVNLRGAITLSNDSLSSWVSAFATVTIAVLTIVLAKETWALRVIQLSQIEKIRKDSIKPSVNVYLKSNPAGFNFTDVYVVNSGSGMAQDIKFSFADASDDARDAYEYLVGKFNALVIFEKGMSSLRGLLK